MGNRLNLLGHTLQTFHSHLARQISRLDTLSDEDVREQLRPFGFQYESAVAARLQWLYLLSRLQSNLSLFLLNPPEVRTASLSEAANLLPSMRNSNLADARGAEAAQPPEPSVPEPPAAEDDLPPPLVDVSPEDIHQAFSSPSTMEAQIRQHPEVAEVFTHPLVRMAFETLQAQPAETALMMQAMQNDPSIVTNVMQTISRLSVPPSTDQATPPS